MLACLDELDNLLTVASISEADCIAGIRKADRALERCLKDGDVQCAILMKRAQLLKTVVSFQAVTVPRPVQWFVRVEGLGAHVHVQVRVD